MIFVNYGTHHEKCLIYIIQTVTYFFRNLNTFFLFLSEISYGKSFLGKLEFIYYLSQPGSINHSNLICSSVC